MDTLTNLLSIIDSKFASLAFAIPKGKKDVAILYDKGVSPYWSTFAITRVIGKILNKGNVICSCILSGLGINSPCSAADDGRRSKTNILCNVKDWGVSTADNGKFDR